MKQLLSIVLITLLFFNWYGYRVLSDYLQTRSVVRLEARLDKDDYNPAELIEIRVPLNLPYHNDWTDFERYNGEIEINGVHYNYVKRKLEKGELVLLCLPNNEKQLLQSARDQFFQLVNDLQQPGTEKSAQGGTLLMLKNLLTEYRQEENQWSIASISAPALHYLTTTFFLIPRNFARTPEQPPDTLA